MLLWLALLSLAVLAAVIAGRRFADGGTVYYVTAAVLFTMSMFLVTAAARGAHRETCNVSALEYTPGVDIFIGPDGHRLPPPTPEEIRACRDSR